MLVLRSQPYRIQLVGILAIFLVFLFLFSVSQYSSFSPNFGSRVKSAPASATPLLKDVYNQTLGVSIL
jgi:hypothetical protein